jgi:hypothetical protein
MDLLKARGEFRLKSGVQSSILRVNCTAPEVAAAVTNFWSGWITCGYGAWLLTFVAGLPSGKNRYPVELPP